MISVRQYQKRDFKMLSNWWSVQREIGPKKDAIPGTTFILEEDRLPALSVSLYLTNGPFCHVDNFVGNPDMKDKKFLAGVLLRHISLIAKDLGYQRLFCMGYKKKLVDYYESIGFNKTSDKVSTFTKEL